MQNSEIVYEWYCLNWPWKKKKKKKKKHVQNILTKPCPYKKSFAEGQTYHERDVAGSCGPEQSGNFLPPTHMHKHL